MTHAPFAFLHVLLKLLFTYGLFSVVSVCITASRKYFRPRIAIYDFETLGCTLPLLGVLKRLTETSCNVYQKQSISKQQVPVGNRTKGEIG